MDKKRIFWDSKPEKTEICRYNSDQINSQTKLGLLMLGSPGKVFRLSGTQQAQARRKSFRRGYYSCN